MDVIFGFVGDGFAVLVADSTAAQQIIVQKPDQDKIVEMDTHKLMALSGSTGDCTNFSEYIMANLKLYELRHQQKLTTNAAANYTRNELATALRKGPYQTNILLAGYDEHDGVSLYFMDYLAAMHKVNSGGHGYGGMFCLSLFDKHWKPGMNEAEALELVDKCIAEVRERLVTAPGRYLVKIVDKDGCRLLCEKNFDAPSPATPEA